MRNRAQMDILPKILLIVNNVVHNVYFVMDRLIIAYSVKIRNYHKKGFVYQVVDQIFMKKINIHARDVLQMNVQFAVGH